MIVDAHTHIFPPAVAAERDRYLSRDAGFRELYANPKATLASADDLLASMHDAGIDASLALGFAWAEWTTCRLHNDYLLETADRSAGRIVAFCTLPLAADLDAIETEMRRCHARGARGFGELRPDDLGFDLAGPGGDRLAAIAEELDVILHFHVTEPAGHEYAGKRGLTLWSFYRFVQRHPGVRVIGAHWAGGLPFYIRMPEVASLFAHGNLSVDTAASSLLYDDAIYGAVCDLAGPATVMFGSDFPLLTQKRSRRRIEEAGLADAAKRAVLGDNTARWLGLA